VGCHALGSSAHGIEIHVFYEKSVRPIVNRVVVAFYRGAHGGANGMRIQNCFNNSATA
jgi:hypothetical protein